MGVMVTERICQKPTEPYRLRTFDQPLILGTLQLATWLLAQPECTAEQRTAIQTIKGLLQVLPNPPPPNLCGSFGFEFISSDIDSPYMGCWDVGFCRSCFEIFCTGFEDEAREFGWQLCPGEENHNGEDVSIWLSGLSNPRAAGPPRTSFKIVASIIAVVD